jgi:hypothetical protein
MGKSGSVVPAAEVYASICRVRKDNSLGCKTCLLKDTVGCPESGGTGRPVPDVSRMPGGTEGGRPVDGYKCHLDLTNFTYNWNSYK